jgi:hypothetical protein
MSAVVIKRLSHRHEQILNWLLLNPHKSLGECALFFGYTQAWLSTLIHSDLFQSELRRRQGIVQVRVAESIPEKLRNLGDMCAEKMYDAIEKSNDPDFILNSFDKVMHRLGYAPKTAASEKLVQNNVTQNNVTYVVDRETLAAARARIIDAGQRSASQVVDLPVPKVLPGPADE